jgi:hypothetical protein
MPSHYKDARVPCEVARLKQTFSHQHNLHANQLQESFAHVSMSDIFHTKLSLADDAFFSIAKQKICQQSIFEFLLKFDLAIQQK